MALHSVSVSELLGTGVVETALADTEEITVTINPAQNLMVVTCDRVHKCTDEDSTPPCSSC